MNYYLQSLTRIAPLGGHRIEAVFGDGFTGTVDLLPWVQRGGFRAPLADATQFAAVVLNEFGAPEWPNEIDLSPGTLRSWCEAGRVLSRSETDAWIAEHSRAAQSAA